MEMLMGVAIEKTDHSLFSERIDPDLAMIGGETMINAEGENGEKATFRKRYPVDGLYGKKQGKTESIAIMLHPSNNGHPGSGSRVITDSYPLFPHVLTQKR